MTNNDHREPPPDPLAELQALQAQHDGRHYYLDATCDPDHCAEARWLALCDRLAAADSHPALTTPPICGSTGLTVAVEARFRAIRAEKGESPDGGCGQQLGWLHAYRCLECGRWMHAECLRRHFAEHGNRIAAAEHERDRLEAAGTTETQSRLDIAEGKLEKIAMVMAGRGGDVSP